MLKSHVFEVTIKGKHTIVLPKDVVQPFLDNGLSRVQVHAEFGDKEIYFHAAILGWQGNHIITFGKKNQKVLGVFPNDYFTIQLLEDLSKYGADMPEELEAVLASDPEAFHIFERLTAGKKRSIIYMIGRYASPQTRINKALILCRNLRAGVRITRELLKSIGE